MKYEDMKIKTSKDGYKFADNTHMIVDRAQQCIICNAYTKSIDVSSETHICSTECEKTFYEQIEQMSR